MIVQPCAGDFIIDAVGLDPAKAEQAILSTDVRSSGEERATSPRNSIIDLPDSYRRSGIPETVQLALTLSFAHDATLTQTLNVIGTLR